MDYVGILGSKTNKYVSNISLLNGEMDKTWKVQQELGLHVVFSLQE